MKSLATIKNCAKFSSSFLDDSKEDDSGDVVVPVGFNIASALSESISNASAPTQHSFYGWRLTFEASSGRIASLLLQKSDTWLLIVEVQTAWFESLGKREAALNDAIRVAKEALDSIVQISDVRWLTQAEL